MYAGSKISSRSQFATDRLDRCRKPGERRVRSISMRREGAQRNLRMYGAAVLVTDKFQPLDYIYRPIPAGRLHYFDA